MPFVCKYGWALQLFWKPIRDVLQRWRLSLASLVFFTIFLTNNFGLTTSVGRVGISEVGLVGAAGVKEPGGYARINGISGAAAGHLSGPGGSKSKHTSPSSSSSTLTRDRQKLPSDNTQGGKSTLLEYYWGLLNMTAPAESVISQCLELSSDIAEKICSKPANRGKRSREMRSLRFGFCKNVLVYYSISKDHCNIEEVSETECRVCLEEVEKLDLQARAMYCLFQDLLSRYDCKHKFSTHWTCSDCEEAYKNWVCAMTIPYYSNTQYIPPCEKYCELVETRCPYFQPHKETLYAGEPSFLCRALDDSYVPYSEDGYSSHSSHTDQWPCHYPCQNGQNATSICVPPDNATLASLQSTAPGGSTSVQLTHHSPGGGTHSGERTQTYTALTPGANATGIHSSTSSGALSSVFQCSTKLRTWSFLQNNCIIIVAQLAFLLWHIWTLSIQSLYRVIGLT